MTPPLNAKGKPFSASYTALADFENCPARYAAARFYCTSPFQETEASIWGNRVHKAAELFAKGRNPNDPEALAPVESYVTAMLRSGHYIEAELELALDRNMRQVKWFSKDAWLRAKLDIVLTKRATKAVSIFDWKTGGKIKDDPAQIKLNIAMLAMVRKDIKEFDGKYIWTAHKQTTGIGGVIKREDVKLLWADFLPRFQRMEDAWVSENFPARPSGLCPWCPVEGCTKRRGSRR